MHLLYNRSEYQDYKNCKKPGNDIVGINYAESLFHLYSTMLIEKLRTATRPMHEQLDQEMGPHIHNIQTKEQYIALLLAFYGFFAPMYHRINAHLDTTGLPDYNTRRKPEDILQNLRALGHGEPPHHLCQQLPGVEDNAGAFGALYVLEGSTLGGLMIKKMIGEQTGLPEDQLTFFAGYGKQTRRRWDDFITALNATARTAADEASAITAAAATFTAFSAWLRQVYF